MANNEIKCPHCKKVFRVDETEFSSIVKQVRDKEFERELRERETLLKKEKEQSSSQLRKQKANFRRMFLIKMLKLFV